MLLLFDFKNKDNFYKSIVILFINECILNNFVTLFRQIEMSYLQKHKNVFYEIAFCLCCV